MRLYLGFAVSCLLTLVVPTSSALTPIARCQYQEKTPAPAGRCHLQGRLLHASVISKTTEQFQSRCANKCLSDPFCQQFSYANDKTCTTYRSNYRSRFERCKSGIYFWQRDCYKYVCDCPSPYTYCNATQSCADVQLDNANCGACGVKCPANTHCSAGACVCDNGKTNPPTCGCAITSCPQNTTLNAGYCICDPTVTCVTDCGPTGYCSGFALQCVCKNGNLNHPACDIPSPCPSLCPFRSECKANGTCDCANSENNFPICD